MKFIFHEQIAVLCLAHCTTGDPEVAAATSNALKGYLSLPAVHGDINTTTTWSVKRSAGSAKTGVTTTVILQATLIDSSLQVRMVYLQKRIVLYFLNFVDIKTNRICLHCFKKLFFIIQSCSTRYWFKSISRCPFQLISHERRADGCQ